MDKNGCIQKQLCDIMHFNDTMTIITLKKLVFDVLSRHGLDD